MSSYNQLKEFPVFYTDRLVLRELVNDDAPTLFNYYSEREVTKFLNWFGPSSEDHAKEIIARWSEQFRNKEIVRWGIAFKSDNILIGTIISIPCYVSLGVNPLPPITLGYELSKQHWNKGIMTEALKPIINFWFDTMNVLRLQATVDPQNEASSNVLKKLGFVEEGLLKKYEYHTGYNEFYDRKILALLNDNYIKPY